MNHRSQFLRGSQWLVGALLTVFSMTVSADEGALQEKVESFWAKELYQAPRIAALADLAQERILPPPEQTEWARLSLPRIFGDGRVSADERRLALYQGMIKLDAAQAFRYLPPESLSWRRLHLTGDIEAPAWAFDYLAGEIQKLSIKGRVRKQEPLAPSRGRQEAKWETLRDPRTNRVIKSADALALAGPATKEGSASYRKTPSGWVVRIPFSEAAGLEDWLTSRGYDVILSLRRDVPLLLNEPIVMDGRMAVPAWIVSPRGMHPATLIGFAAGGTDSCSDSRWMELALEGDQLPEVWAILLLPHPDMAKAAIVKRVSEARPDEGNGEARRDELEVRWSDNRFEPLQITAKRYEVTFSQYAKEANGDYVQISSEPIGTASKVEVRAKPDGKTNGKPGATSRYEDGYVPPLSVTGTPKCAPR